MSLADRFPPTPDHAHEYGALLNMLESVLGEQKADYVSSPLTTGARFVKWFADEGHRLDPHSESYRSGHQHKVVRPNIVEAKRFVADLRASGNCVIEPTSLDVAHWTQSDYRHLWGLVIQRYARRVFFMNGWEFSSGCAYEFWMAASVGVQTLTRDHEKISYEHGRDRIRAAAIATRQAGMSTRFLDQVVAALEKLCREGQMVAHDR
jgi:hypothetical protein